jgi:two-component system cell cycle response regulator
MMGQANGTYILVVDNEPLVLNMLRQYLNMVDLSVLTAPDGPSALEALDMHEDEIALVLLDIAMPGMNGYQVFEKMKDNPKTAHIPVIAITALGPPEGPRVAQAGMDAFISKPFSPKQLKQMLDDYGLLNEVVKVAAK